MASLSEGRSRSTSKTRMYAWMMVSGLIIVVAAMIYLTATT